MDENIYEVWERCMPSYLKHDIDECVKGMNDPECTHVDCLLAEVYGSINAAYHDGEISREQADYLRNKYYYGGIVEDE